MLQAGKTADGSPVLAPAALEPDPAESPPDPAPDLARVVAGVLAFGLLLLGGVGVIMLGPGIAEQGQALIRSGQTVVVVTDRDDGKAALTVTHEGAETGRFGEDGTLVQFQPTARPVDVDGDGTEDLAVYGWTGGQACCFQHFVFSGADGRLLSTFEQDGDTPALLVRADGEPPQRGIFILLDGSSPDPEGATWASGTARTVILRWDEAGNRLELDAGRMRAAAADAPAPYWSDNDGLVAAVSTKTGENGFHPPTGPMARGEVGRAYRDWFARLSDAVQLTLSTPQPDPAILAAFLDEQIYKGQAEAGLAAVRRTGSLDPVAGAGGATAGAANPAVEALIGTYMSNLKNSRWFTALDQLNNGALGREVR